METMRLLGQAGAPIPMPVGNKTYRLSPLTKRRQSEIEAWLIERAKTEAARDREQLRLSDEVYSGYLARVNAAIVEGRYKFGGPGYRAAMQTLDGLGAMLTILLRPNHPTLTEEEIDDLLDNHAVEVQSAVELLTADLKKRMGVKDERGSGADPTPPAPAS